MTDLTEEDKKRLVEFCPRVDDLFYFRSSVLEYLSDDEFYAVIAHNIREKLVEKGKWREFRVWARLQYEPKDSPDGEDFIAWLFTPARFVKLAAEFLKEEK